MIVYVVPTRGRPQNAMRLLEAFRTTGTYSSTKLIFCIDADDPYLAEYDKAFAADPGNDFGFVVDERRRLGPTLNHVAQRAVQDHAVSAVGFMGDDHIPQTFHWDRALLDPILRDPIAVSYGNDLIQGANLPTAVLMGAHVVRTLGYMVPVGLTHLYIDNAWRDLGIAINSLHYRSDVIIRHAHPVTQQVPWDDTYREANSGEMYAADEGVYKAWRTITLPGDAARLIERRKELLGK